MTSALDFLDSTTKRVVTLIVDEYKNDIKKYTDNSQIHNLDIGIAFIDLIKRISDCIVLSTGTHAKSFGIRFVKSESQEFSSVLEETHFYANNGIVLQTKVIQIIDFLIRLKDEGVIMFTQINFGKPVDKPTYKSFDPENKGSMFMTIQSTKINEFIDEFYFSNIVPTTGLIGFKDRGYKTVEQVRHEDTQCVSVMGIIAAVLIAIFSPILMTYCSTSTINEDQFNSLINVIQEKNRVTKDDTIIQNHTQIINGKVENEKP